LASPSWMPPVQSVPSFSNTNVVPRCLPKAMAQGSKENGSR
jgi:hypothetical protein